MTVLKTWRPKPKALEIVYLVKKFAEREHLVTVRQTFYYLVSIGKIQNTERNYDSLVKILTRARVAGIIPFRVVC